MGMDSTVYERLAIAVTSFASHCVFWDESQGNWNSYGCHVSRVKQNMVYSMCFRANPYNHQYHPEILKTLARHLSEVFLPRP